MYNVPFADEQRCVADELKKVDEPTFTDQICTTHDILAKACCLVDEIAGRLFGASMEERLNGRDGPEGIYSEVEFNKCLAEHVLKTLDHIQRRLG